MVDGFYQWYVPLAVSENQEPASDIAIKKRASLFSSRLIKALKDDSDASRKSPDEIVGLDWDPFLDTQDPDQKYVLGNITKDRGRFFVRIHALRAGKKSAKPSVTAVVAQEKGKWVFADFLSSDGQGLLKALSALKKDRENPHK